MLTGGGASERTARSSNLELARIVAMLSIVAHHYVVNSGAIEAISQAGEGPNALLLQLWGMWGKTAINVFVLITGYFMCEKDFRWRRVAKLVFQIEFWKVALLPLFLFAGLPLKAGIKGALSIAFLPLLSVNDGFTASFLVFYLAMPFLKLLIDSGGRSMHAAALGLLLAVDTVSFTFFRNSAAFTEVSWYCALFLIAAWLRRYPPAFIDDNRACRDLFAGSVALAVATVLAIDALCAALGVPWFEKGLYFVDQSGKAMALAVGLACFLFFRTAPIPQSRPINAVASTTFGVLLVHANSDAMRKVLWQDLLDVPAAYGFPLSLLVLHAVGSMLGVFAASSLLDWLRLRYIEPRCMAWYDANEEKMTRTFSLVARIPGRILCRFEARLASVSVRDPSMED